MSTPRRGAAFEERYTLLDIVGEGSAGVVYRAVQKDLKRVVAIKFLRKLHGGDPTLEGRFLREARTLAALDHPRILKVYDAGDDEGQLYIVTEYFDGSTLQAVMHEPAMRELGRALGVVDELLDALAHVHERGILHRDLKPANLMLADGGVCLADFGLARTLDSSVDLTHAGAIVGTLRYIAPETFRDGTYSRAGDLYAVGTILYELLTGARPFEADSLDTLIRRKVDESAPRLAAARPDLPAQLDGIVAACLETDPSKRYGDAGLLRSDLARCRPRATPESPEGTPLAPAGRPSRRRVTRRSPGAQRRGVKRRTVVGSLLAILLVAIVLVAIRQWSRPTPPRIEALVDGNRAIRVTLHGVPPGARLERKIQDRETASVTLSAASTTIRFENLPESTSIQLRVLPARGDDALLEARVRTPDRTAIQSFTCVPMYDRIFVDFEMHPAGSVLVRCTPRQGDTPAQSRAVHVETTSVAQVHLVGLAPSTDYRIDVEPTRGWGGLRHYHVRTRTQAEHRMVGEAVQVLSNPQMFYLNQSLALRSVAQLPDVRALAVLGDLIPRHDWTVGAANRDLSAVVEAFRDARTGDLLYRTLHDGMEPADRRRVTRGIFFARHPAGPAAVLKEFAPMLESDTPYERSVAVDLITQAHVAIGGPRAGAAIEETCDRASVFPPDLAHRLIRIDREAARRRFCVWLEREAGASAYVEAGLKGLALLGENQDVEFLSGPAGLQSSEATRRKRAIDALARINSPAARRAVLESYRAAPGERMGLWAVARSGIEAAVSTVLTGTRSTRHARMRRDATLVLGILGRRGPTSPQIVERLRELLSDSDSRVAQAAAWSLGTLRVTAARDELVSFAGTSRDELGVGLWALGELAAELPSAERSQLEGLLVRMEPPPGEAGARRAAAWRFATDSVRSARPPGDADMARTESARRVLLFPNTPFVPTGVTLFAGDCVSLRAEDPAAPARTDTIPPVFKGPAPDAHVGPTNWRLGSASGTDLIAEAEGELILSPADPPGRSDDMEPALDASAIVAVRIDP